MLTYRYKDFATVPGFLEKSDRTLALMTSSLTVKYCVFYNIHFAQPANKFGRLTVSGKIVLKAFWRSLDFSLLKFHRVS